MMWPDHCVQGSWGAEYVDGLVRKDTDKEILEGNYTWIEANSGFGSQYIWNPEDQSLTRNQSINGTTGLEEYLNN